MRFAETRRHDLFDWEMRRNSTALRKVPEGCKHDVILLYVVLAVFANAVWFFWRNSSLRSC